MAKVGSWKWEGKVKKQKDLDKAHEKEKEERWSHDEPPEWYEEGRSVPISERLTYGH